MKNSYCDTKNNIRMHLIRFTSFSRLLDAVVHLCYLISHWLFRCLVLKLLSIFIELALFTSLVGFKVLFSLSQNHFHDHFGYSFASSLASSDCAIIGIYLFVVLSTARAEKKTPFHRSHSVNKIVYLNQ